MKQDKIEEIDLFKKQLEFLANNRPDGVLEDEKLFTAKQVKKWLDKLRPHLKTETDNLKIELADIVLQTEIMDLPTLCRNPKTKELINKIKEQSNETRTETKKI